MYFRRIAVSSTMVHIREDEKIKEKAVATLAKMGTSISDAVRMTWVRVATEKALPFEVRMCPMPRRPRSCSSTDRKEGKRFRSASALLDAPE
jgi:DNA-damage-inducible protein J